MTPGSGFTDGTRADNLWGGGLDGLFSVGANGPTPLAVAPWPPRSHRKGQSAFDRDRVVTVLGAIPRLTDLDPRALFASQPHVTWEGVAYYLGDTYHRTGGTWADRDRIDNHFPLVYRRADGREVILGGHHRSAAALVSGRPVRALVVDERGPGAEPSGAGAVTPSLLLGRGSPLPNTRIISCRQGVALIGAGTTVVTHDDQLALEVLVTLGAPTVDARPRIDRAHRGLPPTAA